MKWKLYLGRVAGIQLFIHWTFLILIGWILLVYLRAGSPWGEALGGVGFILAIFACVVLHELGHALAARRFGIGTRHIVLLPIGGVASLERMPEKPRQELIVALAGPAVNVVIVILLFTLLYLTDGFPRVEEVIKIDEGEGWAIGTQYFGFNLMMVNVILTLFNMIPAFPMDGGRVLRALLSFPMGRVRATNVAARIGQLLAIGFVFAGFYGNFFLIFIGIFVFLGAGGEANHENTKALLTGYLVGDVLMTKYIRVTPHDTLGDVTQILLDGQDQEFLVEEEGNIVGVLTPKSLLKGLSEHGKEAPVTKAMQRDFLTLRTDMPLMEVYQTMLAQNYSIGPVYEAGRLVGILDRENINERIMIDQALAKGRV